MKTFSLLPLIASILMAGCADEPENTFKKSVTSLCTDQITLDDLQNPDFCGCVYTDVLSNYAVNEGAPPEDVSSSEAKSKLQPYINDAIATCRNG